jgi:hypothetical protein
MQGMSHEVCRPTLAAVLVALILPISTRASEYYTNWAGAHLADIPALAGPLSDPDGDGEVNLIEFVFGTDPRSAGGITGSIFPRFGSPTGTNGVFSIDVLEREGHQQGAQLDLYLSASLSAPKWFRPWWLRVMTNSQASDPVGSVRENFSTRLPGTNAWFARAGVQLIDPGQQPATFYVATNGNDSNAGTSNAPFATLYAVTNLTNPGDLVYVRGGLYNWTAQVTLSRNGSPGQPVSVRAFPGEHPVCDFTGEPSGSHGIKIAGNWYNLYGLEVVHAGHNGILVNGSSNVVERCVIHESGDTGLHITTVSGAPLASSNLILNCDSYRNYDPPIGGNADGFTAKFILGPDNVFRGCRSWNNSDDGWDFWRATNMIIVDHCMTFSNGFNVFDNPATNTAFNGNGNGFKMGGDYQPGPHRYMNCVSFGNKAVGFDQNNNTAGLTVDNCTAWNNGGVNFNLNHDSTNAPMLSAHVLRNNASITGHGTNTWRSGSLLTNNSWQLVPPATNVTDVLSIDASQALGPRRDDGSLPETPFLRPVPAGRLVNRGVVNGLPYNGSAPDLGAYETSEW